MTPRNWFASSAVLVCMYLCSYPGYAATISAASCSSANVQTAIGSASNGDTVSVPAGNCTWNTTVNLSNKGITLQGAGIGQTNITDGTAGGAVLITGASANNFVSLGGFTFIKSANNSNGILQVYGNIFEVAFRIHHIRILQASSGARGIETVGVYGLIDHVTFDVTATSGSIQSVSVFGSSDGSDGGFTPWMQALSLGTNKAVYLEDCTFNYSSPDEDAIDGYAGARIVIRRSAFNGAHIGFHGFDSGSRRSLFSFEIYNNTFTNNSSTTFRALTVRGGTGVVYGNTFGGSQSWYGPTLMVYRACPTLDQSAWGTCNGTNWQIGSTDFSANASRVASTNGGVKFCSLARDKVCATDATCSAVGAGTCSTFLDGAGTGGYACRDQPGRTHNQALDPIYAWSNTGMGQMGSYDGGFSCGGGLNNYLQSGRDYVENGSARPGYTAYAYPHPLQNGTSSGPAQPTGLNAVVQ